MVLTSFPCFGKNGGRRGSTSGASWNIRTGISEEKREQVLLELGRRGISFCALQEVKLKGCGSIEQTVVDEVKQGSHVEVEAKAMKKQTKNKTFTFFFFFFFPETLSIYLSEYANMKVGYLSRVFSLPDSHYGVNFSH